MMRITRKLLGIRTRKMGQTITACLNKLKYGLKGPYIYQGQILPLICTKPSSPTNSSREMMFSKPILKRERKADSIRETIIIMSAF